MNLFFGGETIEIGIAILSLFALLYLLTTWNLLAFLFDLSIGHESIDLTFFKCIKFPFIKLSDVEYVQKTNLTSIPQSSNNFATAVFFWNRSSGDMIHIRKKVGWYSTDLIFTPSNADKYLEQLSALGVKVERYD